MSYQIERRDLYNYSIVFHYIQRFVLYSSFYNIVPGIIPTAMHYLSVLCLVLKFILDAQKDKFSISWFMTCILGFPFLVIASINANATEFVWLLIFIVMAKNVDVYRLAKSVYIVCGVGTIVVVLSAMLGIIPNNYELTITSSGTLAVRMYMGFIHCNVFGAFLTTIFICHFFLRFYKLTVLDYLYGGFLFAISFFVAYSRTNAIIMLVAIIVIKYYTKPRKNLLNITIAVMVVVAVFSVVCSVYYDPNNSVMVEINAAMTGRLSAAKSAYDEYGFSLMGQDFQTIFKTDTVAFGEAGKQQQVIDNSFMHLLVHYGIIPSIILLWYYFSNTYWLYKNHRMDLLFVLFLSFIQGVSEGVLYSTYNLALFLVATAQYERMSRRRDKLQ